MWVQEPDEPPPSDEQGEERLQTAEERGAQEALAAAEKQRERKMLSVPDKQAVRVPRSTAAVPVLSGSVRQSIHFVLLYV